jgi:hypothetical protein
LLDKTQPRRTRGLFSNTARVGGFTIAAIGSAPLEVAIQFVFSALRETFSSASKISAYVPHSLLRAIFPTLFCNCPIFST